MHRMGNQQVVTVSIVQILVRDGAIMGSARIAISPERAVEEHARVRSRLQVVVALVTRARIRVERAFHVLQAHLSRQVTWRCVNNLVVPTLPMYTERMVRSRLVSSKVVASIAIFLVL